MSGLQEKIDARSSEIDKASESFIKGEISAEDLVSLVETAEAELEVASQTFKAVSAEIPYL